MPYIIASDDFDNIGTAGPYNRVLDNGRGGTTTLTHSATASPSLIGTGDGNLGWNNQTNSSAHVPSIPSSVFGANLEFIPNATAPSVFVSVLNGGSGTSIARVHHTGAYFVTGTTLQIRTVANNGTTVIRAAATPLGAAVTDRCLLSIEKTVDNLSWQAKLTDVATGNVLASISWVATSINLVNGGSALGTGMGYGFAGAATAAVRISAIDILGYTLPALTSPTGTAAGSTAAQGSVTTDIGNGTMYAATAVADLTAQQIKDTGVTITVNAAGVVTPPNNTDLTANTVGYKRQYLQVADVGESVIVRSPPFNTPLPSLPVIQSVNAQARGNDVTVTVVMSGTSGTVSSMQVSLPAHATPAGAVSQGPIPATLVGSDWVAVFQNVPTGRYSYASATATSVDGSDTEVETKTLRIIPLTGTAQA